MAVVKVVLGGYRGAMFVLAGGQIFTFESNPDYPGLHRCPELGQIDLTYSDDLIGDVARFSAEVIGLDPATLDIQGWGHSLLESTPEAPPAGEPAGPHNTGAVINYLFGSGRATVYIGAYVFPLILVDGKAVGAGIGIDFTLWGRQTGDSWEDVLVRACADYIATNLEDEGYEYLAEDGDNSQGLWVREAAE